MPLFFRLLLASFTCICICLAEHHDRRSFYELPISNLQTRATKVPLNGQFPPNNPSCKALPLSNITWNRLKLNDYLRQYPNGKTLNAIDYATKLNASNFVCGIGGACHAGQPCYPLETADWYILYSIQQWNTYMNIYYDAVGYGISIVQSSINALIASLFPATDATAIRNLKANLGIQASLSQVTGTVIMDVMLACGSTMGPWMAAFTVLNFMLTIAQGVGSFAIQEPPAPLKDGFDTWSNVAYYLSQYEQVLHAKFADDAKKRLLAGISTDEGIFGVVKDGNFMDPKSLPMIPDKVEDIRNLTQALGVNMILHTINAFITVGSDPCNGKGKNGAWPEANTLSWCDTPGGTMHNIVIARDDETYNEINNAAIISDYFGISTQLIITSSMNCQRMNKGWNYVPWSTGKDALPKTPDADCVYNLPVCDTQKDDIHHKIHKKKWTTAKACRVIGGLPLEHKKKKKILGIPMGK